MDDIDEDTPIPVPDKGSSTKETWVTFYNGEAAEAFEEFREECEPGDNCVFQMTRQPLNRKFRHVSEETGMELTVQHLRQCFASEMSRRGADAKYIDAFCGRTPSSVLEKHYLDYSPDRLKEMYSEAGLTAFE